MYLTCNSDILRTESHMTCDMVFNMVWSPTCHRGRRKRRLRLCWLSLIGEPGGRNFAGFGSGRSNEGTNKGVLLEGIIVVVLL